MAKYSYRIELQDEAGEWCPMRGMQDTQLSFLDGYMLGRSDCPPPRLAMRIVRSDGKVIRESPASNEVDIGMIAGWPSPEQYEAAADRAMARAKLIRAGRAPGGRGAQAT